MLGREPPWGALTGVRPVKIPAKAMLAGATPAQAEKVLRAAGMTRLIPIFAPNA